MAYTPGSAYSLPYRLMRRYGWQPLIDADFTLGIVKDMPPSSIPPGGCFESTDWILDEVGVAKKRGGTAYQSNALGATTTGVSLVSCPEFPTGAKVIGLGADGNLYDATSGSTSSAGALGLTPIENPRLYVDKMMMCASDGTTAPKKVTAPAGTLTIAAWGGTPPTAKFSTVHISRVVVGNTTANPNRVWFSPIPDPTTTWDTANAYIDTNHNLTALASVQGVLVCFSQNHLERITGNIPPGLNETNDNMQVQSLGNVGCVDARSVVAWGGYLIFAAQDGIWITNGASVESLTEEPKGYGIKSYWRTLYRTAITNGATISAGIYNRDYYHMSLVYGTTLIDHLVCYLPRKTWWRNTNPNMHGLSFATQASGQDELYMGLGSGSDGNRIVKLSGLYNPSGSNTTDADGTAVLPSLTTRNMGTGVGLTSFGHGHLHYLMTGGTPTMKVEVGTGLAAASFSQPSESPLPAQAAAARKRFNVSKDSQGVSVRLTQLAASSQTEVYGVELEQRGYALSSEIP